MPFHGAAAMALALAALAVLAAPAGGLPVISATPDGALPISAAALPAELHRLLPPALELVGPRLTPAQAAGLPPTIQDGIGPGSALHQSGSGGGFICTAAFLLRDPVSATYYLSTAGHCLVEDAEDPAAYTGATDPDKVMRTISICVADCVNNALGLGTYVDLSPSGSYHPIAYAKSGGQGADFGLIELPPEVHDLLRPEMPQWAGPVGIDRAGTGDLLVHYGHGTYCCPVTGGVASRTPADQGRVALSQGDDGERFDAIGWVTGGDSGSGISLAVPDATAAFRGTAALGVITHALEGTGSLFAGTLLQHGIDLAEQTTGRRLALVEEGDPLTAVPDPEAATRPAIAITSPAAGSTVQPVGGAVAVEGSAVLDAADGSQIQVSVDDPTFGFESRLPVTGNESWSATWYPGRAVAGQHTLYARIVGPDGELAQDNQTIKLATSTSGGGGKGSSSGPRTSSGVGPVDGNTTDGSGGGGLQIDIPSVPMAGALFAVAAAAALVGRRRAGR